jgi:hypothetical protein
LTAYRAFITNFIVNITAADGRCGEVTGLRLRGLWSTYIKTKEEFPIQHNIPSLISFKTQDIVASFGHNTPPLR